MYGRSSAGRGQGGGIGLGFKGSSPPWPYVGRGRGGLPRCAYYFGGQATTPVAQQFSTAGNTSTLREQADALRKKLEMIEAKLRDLESNK
ncbi:rRNA methyltransferase [Chloroflexota bacterium]